MAVKATPRELVDSILIRVHHGELMCPRGVPWPLLMMARCKLYRLAGDGTCTAVFVGSTIIHSLLGHRA